MSLDHPVSESQHDPYAALRARDFRWYPSGNFPCMIGLNMQTSSISWEIYERTSSNLALALVGLAQIVPVLGLFLSAGQLIDRVDRRKILMAALVASAAWSVGLAWCSET